MMTDTSCVNLSILELSLERHFNLLNITGYYKLMQTGHPQNSTDTPYVCEPNIVVTWSVSLSCLQSVAWNIRIE